MQLEATISEMESGAVNLRNQLSLEQQAHTQTQRREAAAQQHCQDAAVQLQVKQQEVQSLSAELQSAYASQQPTTLQLAQLQQQLDTREQQRYASVLVWSCQFHLHCGCYQLLSLMAILIMQQLQGA